MQHAHLWLLEPHVVAIAFSKTGPFCFQSSSAAELIKGILSRQGAGKWRQG
jgi:hypothetical protein